MSDRSPQTSETRFNPTYISQYGFESKASSRPFEYINKLIISFVKLHLRAKNKIIMCNRLKSSTFGIFFAKKRIVKPKKD